MPDKISEVRSRWCHPDDREIVRAFTDLLNARHGLKTDGAAIRITNKTNLNFAVGGLSLIASRKRYPIDYAGNGRLVQAGKTQIVTPAQVKKAARKIKK